jgi:hypothetical protein
LVTNGDDHGCRPAVGDQTVGADARGRAFSRSSGFELVVVLRVGGRACRDCRSRPPERIDPRGLSIGRSPRLSGGGRGRGLACGHPSCYDPRVPRTHRPGARRVRRTFTPDEAAKGDASCLVVPRLPGSGRLSRNSRRPESQVATRRSGRGRLPTSTCISGPISGLVLHFADAGSDCATACS